MIMANTLAQIGSLMKDVKLKSSLPYFERALDIMRRPEIGLPDTHHKLTDLTFSLAKVHIKLGNYQESLDTIQTIISKVPEDLQKDCYVIRARALMGIRPC